MAGCRAVLLDLEEEGVAVTIDPDLSDFLRVAAALSLHPDCCPRAAPVRHDSGLDRLSQRLLVHVCHHEDVTSFGVLGNGGYKAVGVVLHGIKELP